METGQKAFFEYHCWENENSSDAILWKHTRQEVTVIAIPEMDEADKAELGQMYCVRFADGLEYDVFNDELYF